MARKSTGKSRTRAGKRLKVYVSSDNQERRRASDRKSTKQSEETTRIAIKKTLEDFDSNHAGMLNEISGDLLPPIVYDPAAPDQTTMRSYDRYETLQFAAISLHKSNRALSCAVSREMEDQLCDRASTIAGNKIKTLERLDRGGEMLHFGSTTSTYNASGTHVHLPIRKDECKKHNGGHSVKLSYPSLDNKSNRGCLEVVNACGQVLETLYYSEALDPSNAQDARTAKIQKRVHENWFDDTRTLLELDPIARTIEQRCVGNSHFSATIASQIISFLHKDCDNAGKKLAGPLDFHISFTETPAYGFLVYLPETNGLRPIIVVQRRYAISYFAGGSDNHCSVHIKTYLRKLEEYCNGKLSCTATWDGDGDDTAEERIWITHYTKRLVAQASQVKKQYEKLGKSPQVYTVVYGRKSGQTQTDRTNREGGRIVSDTQQQAKCITSATVMKAVYKTG